MKELQKKGFKKSEKRKIFTNFFVMLTEERDGFAFFFSQNFFFLSLWVHVQIKY